MVKTLKYPLVVVQSCLFLWVALLLIWGMNWKFRFIPYSGWMEIFKDTVGSSLGMIDLAFIAIGVAVLFLPVGLKNRVFYWSALVLAVILSLALNNSLTPG